MLPPEQLAKITEGTKVVVTLNEGRLSRKTVEACSEVKDGFLLRVKHGDELRIVMAKDIVKLA